MATRRCLYEYMNYLQSSPRFPPHPQKGTLGPALTALMEQSDGSTLEAIKQSDGQLLHLPNRKRDYPDRERLAQRFEIYQKVS